MLLKESVPSSGECLNTSWKCALQDLKEIFDAIESIPNKPRELLEGFKSWARGEQDPDWKK